MSSRPDAIRRPRARSAARRPIALALLGAAASVAPAALRAQDDGPTGLASASPACLATVPAERLVPAPLFLEAVRERERIPAGAHGALDRLVGAVAAEARRALGATGDALPSADSALDWRTLETERLVVVLRRGAAPTWRASEGAAADAAAPRLLAAALAAARRGDPALGAFPDDLAGDSLTVALRLDWPAVDAARGVARYEARFAVSVASLRVPPNTPLVPRRQPPPRYPSMRAPAEGLVIMRFVVDTTGRTVPGTIRDQWPDDRPRLKGEIGDYYNRFVANTRESLVRATFEPARVGGCAVRSPALQEFHFGVTPP